LAAAVSLFKALISERLRAGCRYFPKGASNMPGRGSQTFQKRQKEQQRKERQQEKFAKRLAAKNAPPSEENSDEQIESGETAADTGTDLNPERPSADGV
jgi:hypothetical protein